MLHNEKRTRFLLGVLLFAITLGVFLYTVEIRRPWFGVLSKGRHQWLTGGTLKFSKNWFREGAYKLRFSMLENPSSVEFQSIADRKPYVSYPPGAIVPVYLISKVTGREPTPASVMAVNLLNHFLIALILSLTILFFLIRLNIGLLYSFLFSLIPIPLELLLPGPLYYHQNVYFADQAIILPFVFFIFLEALRPNIEDERKQRLIELLQRITMFYGILTDWLFMFIITVVYLKRVVNGESGKDRDSFIRDSAWYWFPAVLAMGLFALQIYAQGSFLNLVDRFFFRTGLGNGGEMTKVSFYRIFWQKHMYNNYGKLATYLILVSLIILTVLSVYLFIASKLKKQSDPKIKETLSLMAMFMVPCFLQVYFLKNHSAGHDFSTLKFSTVLATVPFVLQPILIILFLGDLSNLFIKHRERLLAVALVISCAAAGAYVMSEHNLDKSLFPKPCKYYEELGGFLQNNTGYSDIIFSSFLKIPENPPQMLSSTMKRVYKISSTSDIYVAVKDIDRDYTVDILLRKDNLKAFKQMISVAYECKKQPIVYEEFIIIERGSKTPLPAPNNIGLAVAPGELTGEDGNIYYLYKFRKDDFLKKYKILHNHRLL